MPYVSESRLYSTRSQVTPTGQSISIAWPGAEPRVTDHSDITRSGLMEHAESQYGYRTKKGSGVTPELDLPRTSENWSDSVSLVKHLDELERVTSTSPKGARGNFTVNERVKASFRSGSVTIPASLGYSYNSGGRRTIWDCTAAVSFPLLPYTPPSSRMASSDEPDFGRVLRDMRPTKPHAEMAMFVAELADTPRSVATTLANLKGQKLSQGPINYQFGVAPAISEIKALASAVSRSGKITNNFVRQSGRVSRRSRSWSNPPASQTIQFQASLSAPRLSTPSVSISANVTLHRETQRFYRTGANYQYYVADPSGFASRAQRYRQMADHLLGSNFDAAVLWEITPWSWLIDWYVDIGGLIAYQESVVEDSLVLRGGYKSTFDRVVDTYNVQFSTNRDDDPSWSFSLPPVAHHVVSYFRHVREGASPYSWSTDGEVTPRRASILTALGLARVV